MVRFCIVIAVLWLALAIFLYLDPCRAKCYVHNIVNLELTVVYFLRSALRAVPRTVFVV